MLKHTTALIALLATATPAFPLSCAGMDIAALYQQAAEATERYVIVHGAFLRNGPDLLLADTIAEEGIGTPYTVDMLFYGDLGSRVGFHTPVELEVTVAVSCVLGWCGAPPEDGREVLAFLRVDQDRAYHLAVGPCSGWVIHNATEDDLNQISACMRGEGCDPEI